MRINRLTRRNHKTFCTCTRESCDFYEKVPSMRPQEWLSKSMLFCDIIIIQNTKLGFERK